ncbi:alpha/beta fold hydrolase [Micromonospora siamensis]|uniref:Pimeloyl-ACP methyl ester carboxylesterase n=1 Tax=Micromonospora siamensis TaxID=299152 RepID=A0A1C5HEI1_9ACTN|nr:alpha/beta hydrolase [Micromonospora siamensis]SCG44432.1 Pimeloyl-ACP methyl ester carboxylesterase [Micromonospora siamensis]
MAMSGDHRQESRGTGTPLVLVAGTGSSGRVWHLHQVAALAAAGHRVTTFDNLGTPGRGVLRTYRMSELVDDTVHLLESLDTGPVRLVGFSLGARVVQELLLVRPELVSAAVLMGTRARADHWTLALAAADREFDAAQGTRTPRSAAIDRALRYLSPQTFRDERATRDWLEIFERAAGAGDPVIDQVDPADLAEDRTAAYRRIRTRCMVMAFGDDRITPAHLGREVADAVPASVYREVPGCGHYGYLERPKAVNSLILEFFGAHPSVSSTSPERDCRSPVAR